MLESKIKGLEYLTRAAVEEVVVNSNGQNELVRKDAQGMQKQE
jgi:hypothetical protein